MTQRRESRRGARERRDEAEHQQRLIYFGVAAALVVAAIVVLVGVFLTVWRPPRAHVLTIDGVTYSAADVADRATYLAIFEGRVALVEDAARSGVDTLVDEAVLRTRGPDTVGPVEESEVRQEIRALLGLVVGQVGDGADDGADDTDDDAAIDEAFADAYQRFLQRAGLERDEFEAIVEAQVVARRLDEQFEAALGDAGPQVRLDRIRLADFALAEVVRQDLVDGGDFAELKARHGVDDGSTGDEAETWRVVTLLDPDVEVAVRDLEAGAVSAVVESGVFFDVYQVIERDDARAYSAVDRFALLDAERTRWLDLEIQRLDIREDLSADEARWINDRVLERRREIEASLPFG